LAYYADPSTDSRQVLRGTAETLTVTVYSGETGTDASTGSVTIGIVDETGATVVPSGTSTTSSGSGVYAYVLQAQTDLKKVTATWSGTWGTAMTFDTHHEVVGGWYATPAEVRAMDSILDEATTFPLADLIDAIDYATAIIDDYTGASFVQRYHRFVMNGTDTDTIRLPVLFPTTLLSASVDGSALSASKITEVALFDDGLLQRKSDLWDYTNPGNLVTIEVEAGVNTSAPNDIRWAARTLARFHLLEQVSKIPSQAISVQSEFGQIQLAQPGMNRPSPLPDVNVVLNRHRHRGPTAF
tara:strand:+ start:761 stop:1654 length:894 start_codon:yes stop_codon:yes gene_type:complete